MIASQFELVNVQELKKRLSGGFRPLAIRTADGQEFAIPHPEFPLLGKNSIAVRDRKASSIRWTLSTLFQPESFLAVMSARDQDFARSLVAIESRRNVTTDNTTHPQPNQSP